MSSTPPTAEADARSSGKGSTSHAGDQPDPGRPSVERLARSEGGRRARFVDVIEQVERAWLGFDTPPLHVRVRESGWQPDHPDEFCPRCGRSVGPHESVVSVSGPSAGKSACSRCRDDRLPWMGVVRLGPHAGLLRDCVHEIKFHAWRRLGWELGRMLGEAVKARLVVEQRRSVETVGHAAAPAEHLGWAFWPVRIVPMPMPNLRRMVRGIDHTLAVARGMRSVTGWPIARPIARAGHRPQIGLSATARLQNVRGTFRPAAAIWGHAWLAGPVQPRTPTLTVLVDDVLTTGATCAEACKALAHAHRASDPGDHPPSAGRSADRPTSENGHAILAAVLSVAQPVKDHRA